MSEQMDKAMAFLRGFETPEEFVAYCEGNGITGTREKGRDCLIANAVKRVLGHSDVACGMSLRLHEGQSLAEAEQGPRLPATMTTVLSNFDRGQYPLLERR